MKSVISFILGVIVASLSVQLINNDFNSFDIIWAIGLIVTYVYAALFFRTGFSFWKLVIGSLGILLVLIILSFAAEIDVGVYSGLIFVIFYVEAIRKKKETNDY
ncbi:hypothetical protein SAMN04487943_105245 [Gracilibacillus orientalis]|uniref:Uncharacterized protein n=1 Tax=Gracilibacillus orientalis TaxID=334253 RepID=A0A1I4LWG1_9BACI|nr:hypothetical protein [Gracilibacillus orientalis]SFL95239.1 hypothetical protein SAMN04487943_105245 [Gracilibacillus orientalis]